MYVRSQPNRSLLVAAFLISFSCGHFSVRSNLIHMHLTWNITTTITMMLPPCMMSYRAMVTSGDTTDSWVVLRRKTATTAAITQEVSISWRSGTTSMLLSNGTLASYLLPLDLRLSLPNYETVFGWKWWKFCSVSQVCHLAEEEGGLHRRGLLEDMSQCSLLMVIKIIQGGIYAELAIQGILLPVIFCQEGNCSSKAWFSTHYWSY